MPDFTRTGHICLKHNDALCFKYCYSDNMLDFLTFKGMKLNRKDSFRIGVKKKPKRCAWVFQV